jgi:DNA mismatch endonuclease (patch repair protein)
VLPRHHAVIFVHGCFWHRHEACRYTTIPSTRPDFWAAKFESNIARDTAVRAMLLKAGWRVATVWECALRKPDDAAQAADLISNWLLSDQDQIVLGEREVRPPHSGNDGSNL